MRASAAITLDGHSCGIGCATFCGSEAGVAEFRQLWHEALPTKSGAYDVWDGYAELCLFLGDEAGYRDARRDLLKQFEDPVLDYIAGARVWLA